MKNAVYSLCLVCLFISGPSVRGQEHELLLDAPDHVASEARVNLVYDDGEADNGSRPTVPADIEYAMQFTGPSATNELRELSFCLVRLPGDSSTGEVEIHFYDAGRRGPGRRLESFEATVTNVTTNLSGRFHVFDMRSFDVELPRTFYVSVRLDSLTSDAYLCLDYDGTAGNRPVYASLNGGAWTDYRQVDADTRAFMIRTAVDDGGTTPPPPPPPSASCNAGSDAVFLLQGRFRVDVCWQTADGKSGVGRLANRSGSGATLWFFNQDNPELFVKARDACVAPFNRFWFFAAGLTNVGVTVTVTDTETGLQETYDNPTGRAFVSVQDTTTFATCP